MESSKEYDHFYFNQNLNDAVKIKDALGIYKKRVEMGGEWLEEVFLSSLIIGELKRKLQKNSEEVARSYLQAHAVFPNRAEPIYLLASLYNSWGDYSLTYPLIKRWKQTSEQFSSSSDSQADWMQKFGIDFQYSLCAYQLGHHQEFLDICDRLLANKELPDDLRKQIKINKNFSSTAPVLERFHVCTVTNYEHENLAKLRQSCAQLGMDLVVEGMGLPYEGYGTKLIRMKSYLDTLPENDIVMFVDAFDVLVVSGKQTILEKFLKKNTSILVAAEKNCWPDPQLAGYFSNIEAPFKFINTGCWIGYVKQLKTWLKALDPKGHIDDQRLITLNYILNADFPYFAVDHSASLFLCLWDVKEEEVSWQDGVVRFLPTNSEPCVVHANGLSFSIWNRIYKEIVQK